MDEPNADVALLAPVPEEHLRCGLDKCRAEGLVAFGTDAGMVLSEFKALLDPGHSADILFYASRISNSGTPAATYRARFVDYAGAVGGMAKPGWTDYRPSSTHNDTVWSSFYLVRELHLLETPVSIGSLKKRDNKGAFKKTFVPLGPIIIDTPFK